MFLYSSDVSRSSLCLALTAMAKYKAVKLLSVMALLVSGCASQTASLTSDFTVGANNLSVPVHVSGAALGATTADLEGLIKQAAECGIKRSGTSSVSALENRNVSMQWSVNGLIRPGLSSVMLRVRADGLPDHVDVERISLQASPPNTYVREMCEMTANSLLAMREEAAPRSASSQ